MSDRGKSYIGTRTFQDPVGITICGPSRIMLTVVAREDGQTFVHAYNDIALGDDTNVSQEFHGTTVTVRAARFGERSGWTISYQTDLLNETRVFTVDGQICWVADNEVQQWVLVSEPAATP